MKRRPIAEYNFLIRAPRAEDRRHFWTMCRKLGWRHDNVPRAIAGYIRREIRRAHLAERPPNVEAVRQRLRGSTPNDSYWLERRNELRVSP